MTTWFASEKSPTGTHFVLTAIDNDSTISQTQCDANNRNSRPTRLPLDSSGTTCKSVGFEKSSPMAKRLDHFYGDVNGYRSFKKVNRRSSGKLRFPRVEDMPHFHYDFVDLGEKVKFCLYKGNGVEKRYTNGTVEDGVVLVNVICRGKSWVLTRTIDNFRLLDRELHRCLFDRFHSKLKSLARLQDTEQFIKSHECRKILQDYLVRLSQLADDAMNCSAVLNWFELDNHGNHMLVTDESPINVPGIAAAHVIKRYTAQAVDEISLEVGSIISVIDMPPVDESLWWRGKQGFEVGFFPSQCVEVIGDKTDGQTPLPATTPSPHMTPVAKKRGKIVSFLRLFLSSRPSKARLLQSGILKERTFGCDLGEHLAKNNNQDVPSVLKKCAEVIESHGIVDGIYRLSGMSSNIQKLRLAFDGEEPPDLLKECYLRDIHCISSLLKMYFRELPNPLLTYHLYDKFVAAIKIPEESERQIAVHHVVQQLPPPHYRTLEYLLRHLSRVASFSSQTGMHAKNLAIVWSPNLLRPMALDSGGTALLEVSVQAIIIEYLIRNVHVFFDQHAAAAVIVANPRFSTGSRLSQQRVETDLDIAGIPSIGPRIASLSISPPTKLITLEEARARAQSTPAKSKAHYGGSKPADAPQTSQSPVCRTSVDLPVRSKTVDGSVNGRKWKGFFNKGKSFDVAEPVTKSKQTDPENNLNVGRDTKKDLVEGVRHVRSEENLSDSTIEKPPLPVKTRHVHAEVKQCEAVNEIKTTLHQPVTISFTHKPVRERIASFESKRHSAMPSFQRVPSDQNMFYTKGSYPPRPSHRRASTGGEEIHMNVQRRERTNADHRPVSVYDNRPVSIYDNEPTNPCRYSSPVFSEKYRVIPEDKLPYRYSTPGGIATPPLKRTSKGTKLSDQKIAVTGARLAHTPLVQCSNSSRPMH